MKAPHLSNWYPTRLYSRDNASLVDWMNFEGIPFTHPFFDESVAKARSKALNSKFYRPASSPELLPYWSEHLDYLKPSAFIFHVSRCGSTLLSQLLGMDKNIISLSEVPFLDDILRLPFKTYYENGSDILKLLDSAIKIYGQKRSGSEKNLLIKTDSWHIFFWKEIRKLYPEVPFILLYRRPEEVLRSNQKHRGMQAVPGVIEPEVFGFNAGKLEGTGLDEYMGKVLERYFETYLEIADQDSNFLLLNYEEGVPELLKKTVSTCGIILDQQTEEAILQRSGYHSKHPDKVFLGEPKDQDIPPFMEKSVQLYYQLEGIRGEILRGQQA